jgi:hypothetical protein
MRKSFRGKLEHVEEDRIRLSTNNGKTGYKIVKFQLLNHDQATTTESVVQIFKKSVTPTSVIDFDPLLLAAAVFSSKGDQTAYPEDLSVIFDNVVFNQDIFIGHNDAHAGSATINYYVELEQMKLSVDEAAVATLKDMRGSN